MINYKKGAIFPSDIYGKYYRYYNYMENMG